MKKNSCLLILLICIPLFDNYLFAGVGTYLDENSKPLRLNKISKSGISELVMNKNNFNFIGIPKVLFGTNSSLPVFPKDVDGLKLVKSLEKIEYGHYDFFWNKTGFDSDYRSPMKIGRDNFVWNFKESKSRRLSFGLFVVSEYPTSGYVHPRMYNGGWVFGSQVSLVFGKPHKKKGE